MFNVLSFCCYFISYHVFSLFSYFFFNDTATTEIYTLSLHDALPICLRPLLLRAALYHHHVAEEKVANAHDDTEYCQDRKSTRLNSSHANISYAVFCLKKKKQ